MRKVYGSFRLFRGQFFKNLRELLTETVSGLNFEYEDGILKGKLYIAD